MATTRNNRDEGQEDVNILSKAEQAFDLDESQAGAHMDLVNGTVYAVQVEDIDPVTVAEEKNRGERPLYEDDGISASRDVQIVGVYDEEEDQFVQPSSEELLQYIRNQGP